MPLEAPAGALLGVANVPQTDAGLARLPLLRRLVRCPRVHSITTLSSLQLANRWSCAALQLTSPTVDSWPVKVAAGWSEASALRGPVLMSRRLDRLSSQPVSSWPAHNTAESNNEALSHGCDETQDARHQA